MKLLLQNRTGTPARDRAITCVCFRLALGWNCLLASLLSAQSVEPPDRAVSVPDGPLVFDGDTSMQVSEPEGFDLHGRDFTIWARIRTEEGGTIFSKASARGRWKENGKSFFVANGRLFYDIGFVGAAWSERAIRDADWHDVAMTWRHRDGAIEFFVDGEPWPTHGGEDDEEDDATPRLRPTGRSRGQVVRIGYTRPDFPEDGPSYFDGRMRSLRFYSRVLSPGEMRQERAERPPARGLVAAWNLERVLEGHVEDASGRGHTARVVRSVRSHSSAPARKVRARPLPVKLPKKNYTLSEVRPLLVEFCIDCHGKRRSRGELDIESALESRPLVRNLDLWKNVLHRIEHGEMPPAEEEQPSRVERAIMARWLDREINEFDYSRIDDPGFEPARRLTQAEYTNTLRDLLGVDPEIDGFFPSDLSGMSGFDNSANSLFLHPLLLERYMSAADLAIARALPEQPRTTAEKERIAELIGPEPGAGVGAILAARRAIGRFLPRAFRRDVSPREIDERVRLFEVFSSRGDDFAGAMRKTLAATLVSPKFLMRVEPGTRDAKPERVGQFAMASRLSYFLWASMPDDELLELARRDRLQEPEVLRGQVARMISDERSKSLGRLFASQWLGFGILGSRVRLDPIDNPWCTDTLMAAMRSETEMLFSHLVRENRSILRLIDSDFTFLNEELAKHYRLEGVAGARMRRVKLEDERRRGIFGHGSVLAITSFPGRTSPVVRGRWILTDLLGTPPPPPPPNVDEIDDEIRENHHLSQREKLALHREKPQCASCHDEMDPLGLSLENFDWFGRWRQRAHGRRIDAGGRLPDGEEFEGPAGLRRVILATRKRDLVRQVTRKMLSYALGRQLEYYDEPAVRKIVATLEADDHRFGSLIEGIVMSYPFQFRKAPPAPKGSAGSADGDDRD